MFNYHNRQYVFKQSNGELWDFFCDAGQNLCYRSLNRRGSWNSSSVLYKNVYPYFYADMDQEDTFHLLFQDNDGNILYARLDGQPVKSIPILNSKTPAVYNKQLFLAPFKNNVHFFYVLQHENSFMLAYQVLGNSKLSNPRVIDYVSGSSLPCVVAYDGTQNIYAFYQSYDGKYLQLGYKKFNAVQKNLSEFTAVTKYAGNCEYPHVLIDSSGIIHLCYQRRAPKLFEMVYQQKAPDKNLWTAEEVVHSSVHSFEKASILQENNNIVVYWVRDEIIYYNKASLAGSNWGKAIRHGFSAGRQLQCLCCKANSPRSRENMSPGGDKGGYSSQLPPAFYPGTLSSGLKLAFSDHDLTGGLEGDVSQLFTGDLSGDGSLFYGGSRDRSGADSRYNSTGPSAASGLFGSSGSAGSEIRNLLLDAFKQLQRRIDETREDSSNARNELAKLTNSYEQLYRELAKFSIRLGMLEGQAGQSKKLNTRLDELGSELKAIKEGKSVEKAVTADVQKQEFRQDYTRVVIPEQRPEPVQALQQPSGQGQITGTELPDSDKSAKKTAPTTLDPDKLKEWEEWEEPKEWLEG